MSHDIVGIRNWVLQNTTEPPIKESGFLFKEQYFSAEQVAKHNKCDDAWFVDKQSGYIYNVTPIFDPSILGHRGLDNEGMRGQLERRLGGAWDVHNDIQMHSPRAQMLWQAMRIGKIL